MSGLPLRSLLLTGAFVASGPRAGVPLVIAEPTDARLGAIALWKIDGRPLMSPGAHLLSTTARGFAPDRVLGTHLVADTFQIRMGYSRIPCAQTMNYQSIGSALRVDFQFWCDQPTAFPEGIQLGLWAETALARQRNHLGLWRGLDTMGAFPVAHLASEIELPMAEGRRLRIATPNPMHSFWKQAWDRRQIQLEILPSWPSQPTGKSLAGSVLGIGDTLKRTLILTPTTDTVSGVAPPLAGLSQHRGGAFRSAMMFFDELPNREQWDRVSLDRETTPHGNIASMLHEHPKARLGWVAMTDRTSPRTSQVLPCWSFLSPWLLSDSLDAPQGKWSLILFAPKGDSAFLSQDVDPAPSVASAVLTAKARSLSLAPTPLKILVVAIDGKIQGRYSFPLGPQWTDIRATVPLAKGMTNRITLYAVGSDSMVFLDDVRLVGSDGRSMLGNGGFEEGSHPYAADSSRRAWSDFHGPEHLVKAPEEFRTWFRNLVDAKGPEGWESRTYIGCHGHHHDPGFRAPNPAHEFTVDSLANARLFGRIVDETRQLGVYPKMLEFWRTPGFAYTTWTLESALDNGAKFLDVGLVSDGRGSGGVRYLQKPGKRMWGLPLNWWSDRKGDDFDFPVAPVHRILDQGGVVQAGGHPEETFLEPADRTRMDALLDRMESRAGFSWTTPVEWARHADSLLALDVLDVQAGEDAAEIVLSGRIAEGTTVFWHPASLNPDLATATWNDGAALPVRVIEGTAQATLPAAPRGTYRIRFRREQASPSPPKPSLPVTGRRETGLTGGHVDASGVVFVQTEDGSWRRRLRLR